MEGKKACDGSSNLPSPTPILDGCLHPATALLPRMARGSRRTEREWHRKQAASLFNQVWRYLEKKRRTADDDLAMIHAAHASRYHWSVVGKPVNLAVGEWQVSHVYAVLNRPEPSSYHATRCLAICRDRRITGFPLAFAYEALARAAAVGGHAGERDRSLAEARAAGKGIEDEEDRKLLFSDLATVPRARRARA